MSTPKPVLELTTLDPDERPFITIDGQRYDYAVPADFGILDLARLDRDAERAKAMQDRQTGASLSDEDAAELSDLLASVVARILRAPEDVIADLSDVKKLAVVAAFGTASPSTPATAKPNRATRRTGATSSRGSRGSTAPVPG